MCATRTVEMPQADQWKDGPTRLAYLGRQLNNSALCLVLGAGISMPLDLPNWEQLLARLYEGNEDQRNLGVDLKWQAENFKSMFCGGRDSEFIVRVAAALYRGRNLDFESLRRNATLAAIGALVMTSVRGRASTVISFNFDDLLERFLEYHGYVVQAVGGEREWTEMADVEILHPHGLVPSDPIRKASQRIVLTQRDYSGSVGNEASPWRQRLLSSMRSRTCLFIGTSGTDDNLDSLVIRAFETHAATSSSTAYWGVWFTVGADAATQKAWNDRGVFPLLLPDFHEALPSELFAIAQQAAVERDRR